MARFAFVDREKAHHDVAVVCRLLKVSRSGYCAWRSRPASSRAVADELLTTPIRNAFDNNRRLYGASRIHVELIDAGVRIGRKRVARLMRAAQIVGCHRRKRSFSIGARAVRGRTVVDAPAGEIPRAPSRKRSDKQPIAADGQTADGKDMSSGSGLPTRRLGTLRSRPSGSGRWSSAPACTGPLTTSAPTPLCAQPSTPAPPSSTPATAAEGTPTVSGWSAGRYDA